ncbi:MAG: small, acid-soluble spore protein, alpha/beta type [Oscillospiraceae bacterium]|nr:small, acid-soluble spore protein, alpha/beta type [Oscillospiraceae bacterium]
MNSKSNSINIPEAKAAMEKFKMEAASDVGVKIHIKNQNASLTASKQNEGAKIVGAVFVRRTAGNKYP